MKLSVLLTSLFLSGSIHSMTPQAAIISGSFDALVAAMTHYEGDFSELGISGQTLLHLAVIAHNLDMVAFLIRSGADVSQPNKNNFTARDLAFALCYDDVVECIEEVTGIRAFRLSRSRPRPILAVRIDSLESLHGSVTTPPTPTAHSGYRPLFPRGASGIDLENGAQNPLISILNAPIDQTILPYWQAITPVVLEWSPNRQPEE